MINIDFINKMKFCFKDSPKKMLKVLMIFQNTMGYAKSVSLAGRLTQFHIPGPNCSTLNPGMHFQ